MKRFWWLACLLAVVTVGAGEGNKPKNLEASRARLNAVVARLQKERDALKSYQDREKSLLAEVDALDRQLEAGLQEQDKVQAEIQTRKKRLPELETRIRDQQEELQTRKQQLANHMRLVYGMGEQGLLKLALSRDTVSQARQGLRYFGYLVQARQQEFEAYQQALAALRLSQTTHQQAIQELENLVDSLEASRQATAKERLKRSELLARVQKDAQLKQRQVEELRKVREEMAEFVANLEENLARAALVQHTSENILDSKGRLPPPTSLPGRESQPGMMYKGAERTPIRSVFRGQVVYADWFRGYGLLLILDHGQHVYTLYGHNHKLLASQGDWVDAGEVIAELGDTGSMDGPGLYFEIRSRGRPDEPGKWLAKAGG